MFGAQWAPRNALWAQSRSPEPITGPEDRPKPQPIIGLWALGSGLSGLSGLVHKPSLQHSPPLDVNNAELIASYSPDMRPESS